MRTKILILTVLIYSLSMVACQPNESEPEEVVWDKTPYNLEYGAFPMPYIATDNTLTVEGVKLGRMLFYDKLLSGDESMSCASCHMQEFAFTDTERFSVGIHGKTGSRNAMSVFNTAWHNDGFFWDGRARILREQSLMPIQDELEMDESLENVILKLSAKQKYNNQFKRAFGTSEINEELISKALEQFMNSIVSTNSKYDQYLKDTSVFNDSEKRGLRLFTTEFSPDFPDLSGADCEHCHSGLNFANNRFMNNGLDDDATLLDLGMEKFSQDPKDRGKFKVTSLRNIELTAPYMHDGRFNTLEEVVNHYNTDVKKSTTLDPALLQTVETGLMLSKQDVQDLVAFLKTLTDYDLLYKKEYSDPN